MLKMGFVVPKIGALGPPALPYLPKGENIA
jgi:hypothetical protein